MYNISYNMNSKAANGTSNVKQLQARLNILKTVQECCVKMRKCFCQRMPPRSYHTSTISHNKS